MLSERYGAMFGQYEENGEIIEDEIEDEVAALETALKDAMEQSKASQKVLLIEQQKHLDTANWAAEQQERADTAENKVRKLEAVVEAAKHWLKNAQTGGIIRDVCVRREVAGVLKNAIAALEDGNEREVL